MSVVRGTRRSELGYVQTSEQSIISFTHLCRALQLDNCFVLHFAALLANIERFKLTATSGAWAETATHGMH